MKARSMLFTLYGDYVRHFGGAIWTGSLISLMGELGFSSGAVRAALSRTCRQGWLEVVRDGKYSFYGLTRKGQERMEEAARRIFHLRMEAWDGQWTILTYTIPEAKRTERERLRRELEWLGFGRLAAGSWIAPNPVGRVALNHFKVLGMESLPEVFTARHDATTTNQELVQRCWDIPAINRRYQRFMTRWQPRWKAWQARVTRGHAIADRVCFGEKTWLVHEYRKFLFVDPGLPTELLPKRWAGFAAWRLFRDYYRLLADGAIRFFERVFRAPSGTRWDPVEARLQALRNPFEAAWEKVSAGAAS